MIISPQSLLLEYEFALYYSREDLTDLAIVHYLLQRGDTFQSAGSVLKELHKIDPS